VDSSGRVSCCRRGNEDRALKSSRLFLNSGSSLTLAVEPRAALKTSSPSKHAAIRSSRGNEAQSPSLHNSGRGSPTSAGETPALPIFQIRSKESAGILRAHIRAKSIAGEGRRSISPLQLLLRELTPTARGNRLCSFIHNERYLMREGWYYWTTVSVYSAAMNLRHVPVDVLAWVFSCTVWSHTGLNRRQPFPVLPSSTWIVQSILGWISIASRPAPG